MLLTVATDETELLPRLAQARAHQPPAVASINIEDPMGGEPSMYRSIGQQVAAVLLPVLHAVRAELA